MWFRVDDKLPMHLKTRKVRRSHPTKRRDASPFGIWVLAGAFRDDGFIPLEVLEDWDDDAEEHAERLVSAGLWEHAERSGEQGYYFHDWATLNPADASQSGAFGNHMRWHVGLNKPKAGCAICESEGLVPTSGATRPDDRPDIAPTVGGDSLPDPTRPTRPEVKTAPSDDDAPPKLKPTNYPAAFEEWWKHYPSKKEKAEALKAWKTHRGKVSHAQLIAATKAYAQTKTVRDGFIKNGATWLRRECWLDETEATTTAPASRTVYIDDVEGLDD